MDDLDRRLLTMCSAHDFVTPEQLNYQFRLDAGELERRIDGLCAEGWLRQERLAVGDRRVLRVTVSGLSQIGSRLKAPSLGFDDVRRQLAAVWVWVAAWQGVFGDTARVLSRREVEGLDRAAALSAGAPSGFQVAVGDAWMYPDVALVSTQAHRIVIHLNLWPHRSVDVEALLRGYAEQRETLDALLLLVDTEPALLRTKQVAQQSALAERIFVRKAQTGAAGLLAGG